jgi:autotransporter family porin
VAGALAIVHYSGTGQELAASPGSATATAGHSGPGAGSALAGTVRGGSAPAAAPSAGTAGGTGKAGPGAPGTGKAGPAAGKSGRGAPGTGKPGPGGSPAAPPPAAGGAGQGTAPAYFHTLPPGAALPTDAQCAQWVRESPQPENKAANERDNQITGQHVGAHFFSAGDSPQAELLAGRIDGNFTGTTAEILRWAACKWGIDQDVVFAQAAVESWWQQGTLGDWDSDASACPPGHQPGADGKGGQCPQSYGILQNRYPFEQASWPGIGDSTAMNADTAYAIWRSCFDGYETWLNTVPRGQAYATGDLWGCVGRWFAGRWHTAPAQQYVTKVQQYLSERIWLTRDFQQG